ncbi:MAG TPA: hypothetical protein VFS08_06245 [Gemmatimonadaceae bacterium]|nr:hypothetical protein [Gemmatimonadaceae bacterium]
MAERVTAPQVVPFWLTVCSVTGDPGCMDCIEGQCRGEDVQVEAHRCTGCDGDDVYGEMYHEEHCPLYVPPEATDAR